MKTIVRLIAQGSLAGVSSVLRNFCRRKKAQPLRVVERAQKAIESSPQQIRRLLFQQTGSAAVLPTPIETLAFQLQPCFAGQRNVNVALPVRFLLGAYLSVIAMLCIQLVALPGNAAPTVGQSAHERVADNPIIKRKTVLLASRRGRHASRWDSKLEAHPPHGEFVRYFRMKATAYTPINTRMEGGRYTRTERDGRSAHGVAVDPDLIPLGSRLWIPGYGHAIADDTGGSIQGHRIDVRVQERDQMYGWGYRPVRVYVLQEPAT